MVHPPSCLLPLMMKCWGLTKGRLPKPVNNTNNSEACRKSEKNLSKFWADDLDTDQAYDSTLEPDINAKIEGDITDGSLFNPFMSKRRRSLIRRNMSIS